MARTVLRETAKLTRIRDCRIVAILPFSALGNRECSESSADSAKRSHRDQRRPNSAERSQRDQRRPILRNEAIATSDAQIPPNEANGISEDRFCETKPSRPATPEFCRTKPAGSAKTDSAKRSHRDQRRPNSAERSQLRNGRIRPTFSGRRLILKMCTRLIESNEAEVKVKPRTTVARFGYELRCDRLGRRSTHPSPAEMARV